MATLAAAVSITIRQPDRSRFTFPLSRSLFWGLSGLCMLYCLASGKFMTADCLSLEKREGTLEPALPDRSEGIRRGPGQAGGHFAGWFLRFAGGVPVAGHSTAGGRDDQRGVLADELLDACQHVSLFNGHRPRRAPPLSCFLTKKESDGDKFWRAVGGWPSFHRGSSACLSAPAPRVAE